jgi:hypothetical protein
VAALGDTDGGELTAIIDQKESEAKDLRRRIFLMGLPAYLILGGAFAVLFASNALQALLIGFGWTAVADRIGLNRVENIKKQGRGDAISTMADESERTKARLQESEVQRKRKEHALHDAGYIATLTGWIGST